MLGSRSSNNAQAQTESETPFSDESSSELTDDDIPF